MQHQLRQSSTEFSPLLEQQYRRYREPLTTVAQSILFGTEESEDVVQTVFLRLVTRPNQGQDLQIGYRYLRQAVINESLHQVARQKRRRHLLVAIPAPDADPAPLPDEQPARHEAADALAAAIDILPPRCRRVLELVSIHGLSYTEAAREMDISVKTVQEQLRRAK